MTAIRPVLLLVVAALWPAQAAAQIYTWRDTRGTVVVSNRRLNSPALVHEIVGAPPHRATTAPVPGVGRYDPHVVEHAARHAIRPELVRAVIQVESGFNRLARSPKGAMGLMQLMPGTARELGVADPYDAEENIRGGTAHLRQLLDRYAGDEELALAAYNAGAGAVDRYGRAVPPYRETRSYVKKVAAAAQGTGRTPAPARQPVASPVIFKSVEVIGDRVVRRYSSTPPASGTFERISR
jgi:soluble lytic murein transglycosylase-like protein